MFAITNVHQLLDDDINNFLVPATCSASSSHIDVMDYKLVIIALKNLEIISASQIVAKLYFSK